MTRRELPLVVNQFTGGLNTQFNPLSIPPNVSIDEANMDMTLQGSRKRRLGMGLETEHVDVSTSVPFEVGRALGKKTFRWENAGNNTDKIILVVQISGHTAFYDYDTENAVSGNLIYSEYNSTIDYSTEASFSVVDGLLVCVNGEKSVLIYEYNNGTITRTSKNLLIRDFFGVQAVVDGVDLTLQENSAVRPRTINSKHVYNLRNQTWGRPYLLNNEETLEDPINGFRKELTVEVRTSNVNSDGVLVSNDNDFTFRSYPSNADNLNLYVYADPTDDNNKTSERFFARDAVKESPQIGLAPKGFFIIDAMTRGLSRRQADLKLRSEYPALNVNGATEVPNDTTPGGATAIAEYAGRAFFGGFSGRVIGGDDKSPRMSSYILFSRTVNNISDINQCYQEADPTSKVDSDLVETDGGFIRISNAYNISQFAVSNNSLFIFASNGVWRLSGDSDSVFSATNYQVQKITNFGLLSKNSVVVSNDRIFYWSEEGIMVLQRNEFGLWSATNISQNTVQDLYTNIDETTKRHCSGEEDIYEKTIRWVYTNPDLSSDYTEELVFNMIHNSFTYNKVNKSDDFKLVFDITRGQPYLETPSTVPVTAGGVDVTADSELVTVDVDIRSTGFRQAFYLVITADEPLIKYSFGSYSNTNFFDWGDVDYSSYIVTGSLIGQDPRQLKQVPYLTAYFEKTESGFNPDLTPVNQSSCLVSSRWDWTNSVNGKKWSSPRQAYRLPRIYMPLNTADAYDDGKVVIETRNKIRGMGKSVAFRFESESGKNMHIHGWAFNLEANNDE